MDDFGKFSNQFMPVRCRKIESGYAVLIDPAQKISNRERRIFFANDQAIRPNPGGEDFLDGDVERNRRELRHAVRRGNPE